jgi:hypothetical protein
MFKCGSDWESWICKLCVSAFETRRRAMHLLRVLRFHTLLCAVIVSAVFFVMLRLTLLCHELSLTTRVVGASRFVFDRVRHAYMHNTIRFRCHMPGSGNACYSGRLITISGTFILSVNDF